MNATVFSAEIYLCVISATFYIRPDTTFAAKKAMVMKLEIIDCRDLSAKEIIDKMIRMYPWLEDPDNRRWVYVGATGDINERLYRHNAKRVLFCARTANQRVAAAVEEEALRLGFCIGNVKHGGNGTNSFSIYIYAYIIDRYTIE